MNYKLYSSEGCHLCEQAYILCQQANIDQQVIVVDIIDDEKLVELYGISIPVFEHINTGEKLFWPFTLEQLKEAIREF
ncbi:MAG: NrdH-redoxin [Gammaproteobacteria bacterium]|nr:MAG: NrdH-redoxin [Gammaproteobacteria bacterium]